MASILKFKPRKTALELNGEEIERATVERIHLSAKMKRISHDIASLYLERERLMREFRRKI